MDERILKRKEKICEACARVVRLRGQWALKIMRCGREDWKREERISAAVPVGYLRAWIGFGILALGIEMEI